MRAIQLPAPAPGLHLADVPAPQCRGGDVLIRVMHAGVCGTDVHIADWDDWAQSRVHPPLILGHEFAGEIVELGEDVHAELEIGQPVTAEGHIVCGHCKQCQTGNGHVCRNTQIIGVDRAGAFAEFIAMPATNVIPLGTIPTEVGAIMDPLGNAFHTVLSADIPGQSVLVMGCGPIGCFAIGIARAAGASRVLAVDLNRNRLSLARTMGANVVIDPTADDIRGVVAEETAGEGVDVVCEMSGHPTAIQQSLECVKPGGRVQLLGLPKNPVPLRLANDVIFKGITIYGVVGRRLFHTWHQMQRFLDSGVFDPTPVITHRFPVEEIDRALKTIRGGEAGKIIMEIGGST